MASPVGSAAGRQGDSSCPLPGVTKRRSSLEPPALRHTGHARRAPILVGVRLARPETTPSEACGCTKRMADGASVYAVAKELRTGTPNHLPRPATARAELADTNRRPRRPTRLHRRRRDPGTGRAADHRRSASGTGKGRHGPARSNQTTPRTTMTTKTPRPTRPKRPESLGSSALSEGEDRTTGNRRWQQKAVRTHLRRRAHDLAAQSFAQFCTSPGSQAGTRSDPEVVGTARGWPPRRLGRQNGGLACRAGRRATSRTAIRVLEVSMSDQPPAPRSAHTVAVGSRVPAGFAESSLSLPASGMEVAQFVALRASACVGADYSNMASWDRERKSLRLFHGTFLAPEIADRYTDIPLSAPFPIAAAVRLDEPVLLPDLDSYRREFPVILADTIAAGVQATASIPLRRADGSLVGALGFAWAGPTRFDAKFVSALRAVAELCTATIERAEQYDAEHQFVADVSASLLGDLPALAGLDTAAHYLPAGRTTAVGGDWYEGLLLDNDKVALVVGDVVGHGLAAAADMMIIRGMVTAVLHAGVPVAEVFSELATVLQQRATVLLATAALVVVDMAANTITYTTAGHPPPVIQYPTGQFRRLDEANSAMIGLGLNRSNRCNRAVSGGCPPGHVHRRARRTTRSDVRPRHRSSRCNTCHIAGLHHGQRDRRNTARCALRRSHRGGRHCHRHRPTPHLT